MAKKHHMSHEKKHHSHHSHSHHSKHHSMEHAGHGHDGFAMKSHEQGNMSPHLEEYQKPSSDFSQEGFSKTLEYVERQNSFQAREAGEIKKQDYKGRYS